MVSCSGVVSRTALLERKKDAKKIYRIISVYIIRFK